MGSMHRPAGRAPAMVFERYWLLFLPERARGGVGLNREPVGIGSDEEGSVAAGAVENDHSRGSRGTTSL